MRCVFPPWLILTVLLAFMSVSYIDCGHPSYSQVVEDRGHLAGRTQEHVYKMLIFLAVALFAYCCVYVLVLWAGVKTQMR
jgi:hypothetical protein